MNWAEKLAKMRHDLENMVDILNKDEDYDGATACQAALQTVARLDDVMEIEPAEREWKEP